MTDFETLLSALHEARVDFVIVGAYAAVAHGAPVLTRDLDICYDREPANLQRLAGSLQPFHPRLRGSEPTLPFRLDLSTLRQGMNFTLVTDAGDLDLMGELSGVGQFSVVARRAEEITLYGRQFRVASLEVIIASKRAAGRAKDKAVLAELEALKALKDRLKKR